MTINEVEKKLAANARQRKAVEAKRDAMWLEAEALILEGVKVGVPKLKLAQIGQVSRQTVYTIMLRDEVAK